MIHIKRSKWLKIFLIGFVSYAVGLMVLMVTENPNIFTSVVMLGNFLIPITYVTFFYERKHISNVRMFTAAASFFYGGFVGTFSAVAEV